MSHIPDIVITYIVNDESQTFPIPDGITGVRFVATTALWVVGGADDTVVCNPLEPDNVYILANTIMDVNIDQSEVPFFAARTNTPGAHGFATAIWRTDHDENA